MRKPVIVSAVAVTVLAGLAAFLLFSPWGVHFYSEVLFQENETKAFAATDYPSAVTEVKTAETIELPDAVLQPSGIDYDPAADRFFIVTDQAEIITLSRDFQTVHGSVVMSNAPLFFRQGTVESNDFYQGALYVSGDLGEIGIWTQDEDGAWQNTGAVTSYSTAAVSSEGMAINPATGEIFMGSDDQIHVLDRTGTHMRQLALTLEPKEGRSISEYTFAGLDFHDGVLYVLTEYYSTVLAVDPETGKVQEVYGLDGIIEGAGLAVTEDAFFVVVDHELTEPSPGVKVYRR